MSRQSLTSFSTRIIISSQGPPEKAFLLYMHSEMSQHVEKLSDVGENSAFYVNQFSLTCVSGFEQSTFSFSNKTHWIIEGVRFSQVDRPLHHFTEGQYGLSHQQQVAPPLS